MLKSLNLLPLLTQVSLNHSSTKNPLTDPVDHRMSGLRSDSSQAVRGVNAGLLFLCAFIKIFLGRFIYFSENLLVLQVYCLVHIKEHPRTFLETHYTKGKKIIPSGCDNYRVTINMNFYYVLHKLQNWLYPKIS